MQFCIDHVRIPITGKDDTLLQFLYALQNLCAAGADPADRKSVFHQNIADISPILLFWENYNDIRHIFTSKSSRVDSLGLKFPNIFIDFPVADMIQILLPLQLFGFHQTFGQVSPQYRLYKGVLLKGLNGSSQTAW